MLDKLLSKELIRTQLQLEPDLTKEELIECLNFTRKDSLDRNDQINFAAATKAIEFCENKSLEEIKQILLPYSVEYPV